MHSYLETESSCFVLSLLGPTLIVSLLSLYYNISTLLGDTDMSFLTCLKFVIKLRLVLLCDGEMSFRS